MTPVSELLAVKIELAILKVQQAVALHQSCTAAQTAAIEAARLEVNAPVGHLYNVDTKTFQPPEGTRPFSAPTKRQARRAGKTP